MQALRWLARPVLLHWLLPYLMALVVIGTVAQKTIGLFASQKIYFSSFIIWLGPLPLPGGRLVCALLLISLLAKIIIASPWTRATAGIFITHLGVALLLLGGVLTAAFSTDGYVVLGIGDRSAEFFDYHQRELTIRKNTVPVMRIPLAEIVRGKTIANVSFPFTITVGDVCSNCTMQPRAGDAANPHGPAQKVMFKAIDSYREDERNLAGVELAISGANPTADGTYLAFEPMEHQPGFPIGHDRYSIAMGRVPYPLPFTLQLLDAEKQLHPGTTLPRSYRSTVQLSDGTITQRAVLTMNHPLRYKGYTIYQSSFGGADADSTTTNVSFAVVRNSGRVFPYVASVTLCIGLLLHLCLKLPMLLKRRAAAFNSPPEGESESARDPVGGHAAILSPHATAKAVTAPPQGGSLREVR